MRGARRFNRSLRLDLTGRATLHSVTSRSARNASGAKLKTDFAVAPVYQKDVSRIQALLRMYFFVLLVESLLERELRQAMVRTRVESLRMYPEGRGCRYPTVRRLIEIFEDVQRHRLTVGSEPAVLFTTRLSPLQKKILRMLGLPLSAYDA
jgi:hypothetical protein